MYNTSNPAELYPNTTWELLATDKYLKTTTGTPLSLGGSNSLKLSKANLPAEKLQVDSFSVTIPPHNHNLNTMEGGSSGGGIVADYLQYRGRHGSSWEVISPNGGSNTGNASPYTTAMGSGTPLTINPEHITIRAWKRLT